ncbi:MAG: tripartite tricarboxylate transporter substrate binding protein, partial [Pseudomonadota bacterium]
MSQAIRVLLWLVAFAFLGHANAQTWPAKPVKFIVPNSAGSVPDVIARMLGERLSLALGKQFVIE